MESLSGPAALGLSPGVAAAVVVGVGLAADDACPACGAPFNPGCRRHRDRYFEPGC